jgi:hypothetical protein
MNKFLTLILIFVAILLPVISVKPKPTLKEKVKSSVKKTVGKIKKAIKIK